MEGIHGVDVSWLHRSNKGTGTCSFNGVVAPSTHASIVAHLLTHQNTEHHHRLFAPSSPGCARDPPPKTSSHGGLPAHARNDASPKTPPHPPKDGQTHNTQFTSTPQAPATPEVNRVSPAAPTLSRPTFDKGAVGKIEMKRKSSWLSSLSSKFSQSPPPASGSSPAAAASLKAGVNGSALLAPSSPNLNGQKVDSTREEPHTPQAPESGRSSFFSNALRRLSSNSVQTSGSTRPCVNAGICPRRVMNVDKQRQRCLIPELDQAKLRRVAFCVDVEIAGGPKYNDDEDGYFVKQKKEKDIKAKEKSEGEALKHPKAAVEEQQEGNADLSANESDSKTQSTPPESAQFEPEKKEPNKKKEKKKRSEEERKERKEKKRRRAEENGSIPLELTREDENSSCTSPGIVTPRDRPTTDPLRIYRRCCQLRETPILKRIADQLTNPYNTPSDTPGLVLTLDLTGSRLQTPDFATLGDWLAVVPVKKIVFEDSEMTDESVRCVLAGLLAAKLSDHLHSRPLKGSNKSTDSEQRLGVVEKVVIKNNPRLTKAGWKHICLFINMCRSLTAIDLSMIPFPQSSTADDVALQGASEDVSEILSKAFAERLAGNQLEEVVMAECGLTATDIRKIVDGVTICGIRRLGLAGNNLDDEGFSHVTRYVRSGVCEGLDLGGNDLRDRLGSLVESIGHAPKLWALCLANCNLTPESVKTLFPALVQSPDLRFLDLSHNRDLFSQQPSALVLLRKYIPQFPMLKRLHLIDVSLSPAQAIGLSEVLPESTHLAHLNILDNPQLTALASARDESSQEEACALYASLMTAARVSNSLIAIDVAVPIAESCEIVKALAKQVVAYCLQNMERFTAEGHQNQSDVATAVQSVIDAHSEAMKEVELPNVLLHLVGHAEGSSDHTHDNDPPAPCEDYIVSGNGLVKALQYCLKERESDRRRSSAVIPSGTSTPSGATRNTGVATEHAKSMSKSLLGSARKIRTRLQPALAQQGMGSEGDMAYRRLLFLDSVLENMIQRFEDEFPECRTSIKTKSTTSDSSRANSMVSSTSPGPSSEVGTQPSLCNSQAFNDGSDDEDEPPRPALHSRASSDVSLAARALSKEEGHIHRIGQEVRRSILRPQTEDHLHGTTVEELPEPEEIVNLRAKLEQLNGEEMRQAALSGNWEDCLGNLGINKEELIKIKQGDEDDFRMFKEAQEMAILNAKSGK